MNQEDPQQEPSVLDYLKSRLNPRQSQKVELADGQTPSAADGTNLTVPPPAGDDGSPRTINFSIQLPRALPWRTFLAVPLALIGQYFIDPTGFSFTPSDPGVSLRDTDPQRAITMALIFYGIAAVLLLWAYFARELSMPALPEDAPEKDPLTMRLVFLGIGGALSLLAFFLFTDNLFNPVNVTLWLVGLALYLRGLWLYERRQVVISSEAGEQIIFSSDLQSQPTTLFGFIEKWWDVAVLLLIAAWGTAQPNIFLCGLVPLLIALTIVWLRDPNAIRTPAQHINTFFTHGSWQISITRWTLLLVAVAGLILFFRFYRLDGVLAEPFSDHAEKLLDVFDVTQGQTHIFFERNTGREFIQFYWTALMSFLFGTGLSYMSLKIGTVLIGLFALPYVYLLGKEIGGTRVALFALILAGVAYWPNTISRVGLRFPLYPAFVAPTLYHLVKGLRTQKRNQFIMAGLFLGLGLHGYSPFRFMPFVVVATILVYLIHKQAAGWRKQALILSGILVLTSVLVFSPLGRYAMDHPDMFSERAFSRLETDQPLPGTEHCPEGMDQKAASWCILAENNYRSMIMFFWDNGGIWVHSVPGRPALDIAAAVFFGIGYVFLLVRYIHKRRWQDLFLLVSVPLLLMPSSLSISFPGENPSLNRSGGALITVFVIAGLALDGVYTTLRGENSGRLRQGFALLVAVVILGMSSAQSFDLMFNKFDTQYRAGAWNTSDIGKVIKAFMIEGNSSENAWVVPFPYWVDTRLAGIQAGLPTKDFALDRDRLQETLTVKGNKLFIVKDEDADTMNLLHQLYPNGLTGKFDSPLDGKDFWIYTVPDNQTVTQ